MNIAFYAPLKPPHHPVPSGDRRMARLLIEALGRGGHRVELAARLRSRRSAPDPMMQARLAEIGARLADLLVRRYRARPPMERPSLWFTYHLYYKAPDWIGPLVSDALDLPYVVAEASFAPKRAGGSWGAAHEATRIALGRADAVIGLNSHDAACVRPVLRPGAIFTFLPPFLDTAPFAKAAAERAAHRVRLAGLYRLPLDEPWLLVVAMMRDGDKLASYRVLADALGRLTRQSFRLLIVGDGPARPAVGAAFSSLRAERIRWIGEMPADALPGFYAAADVLPWPAVNEAYGMALLEAQAAGLPVVAGRTGGVPDIVADRETGVLVVPGDAAAFAQALADLIDRPAWRDDLRQAALRRTQARHDIAGAAASLDAILAAAMKARAVA
ncbi:MAG: glycosyltransferase family 4 protein [Alphaproteobacteria bacterium]